MILFNSNWSKDPFFTDSDGEFLISRNGKKYLDTWLGSGTLIFGHKPEFLSKSNVLTYVLIAFDLGFSSVSQSLISGYLFLF